MAAGAPGGDPAVKRACVDAELAQLGGGVLADLEAVEAIGDDWDAARQRAGPFGDALGIVPARPRQHVALAREIVAQADVEHENLLAAVETRLHLVDRRRDAAGRIEPRRYRNRQGGAGALIA